MIDKLDRWITTTMTGKITGICLMAMVLALAAFEANYWFGLDYSETYFAVTLFWCGVILWGFHYDVRKAASESDAISQDIQKDWDKYSLALKERAALIRQVEQNEAVERRLKKQIQAAEQREEFLNIQLFGAPAAQRATAGAEPRLSAPTPKTTDADAISDLYEG